MPVAHQQILVAIEVHIQEGGAPGPVGRRHARVVRDLGIGAIPSVEKQDVAPDSRSLGVGLQGVLHRRERRVQLCHAEGMNGAEHVRDEEVLATVTVEVRGHREEAGATQRLPSHQLKPPSAVVQPESIRGLEIVADVNVGKAILVEVPDAHRQTEIPQRRGQRRAALKPEGASSSSK